MFYFLVNKYTTFFTKNATFFSKIYYFLVNRLCVAMDSKDKMKDELDEESFALSPLGPKYHMEGIRDQKGVKNLLVYYARHSTMHGIPSIVGSKLYRGRRYVIFIF